MEREAVVVRLSESDTALPEEWLRLISLPRRERIRRLADPRDRRASLYAALLVRWCACRTLGVSNGELRFARTPAGKPVLCGQPAWECSLSHTRGAVAAAVSDREIGIDVEPLAAGRDRVAARCFTDREQAYLRNASDPDRAFGEIWTRKEAYLKYTGQGLRVPLRSVETVGETPARLTTRVFSGLVVSVCEDGAAPVKWTVFTEREFEERVRSLLCQSAGPP